MPASAASIHEHPAALRRNFARRALRHGIRAVAALAFTLSIVGGDAVAQTTAPAAPGVRDFGPNVLVFDPSMPTSQIQAAVDAVASRQLSNQFGTQRYALLFKPGTYGSVAAPLTFQVGYYTSVAGLGALPTDVTINGHIDVYNQCDASNSCVALNNFWRSLSNLTINVTGLAGCQGTADFWAVSQAAPMRRVNITGGNLTLMDYCTGPSFASGGFIADSQTGFIINGSQQQFFVRNSRIGGWSNAVWNQVFSGVVGAPAQAFPSPTYTTLAASPVTREAPFLYADAKGRYRVFVPAARRNTVGASWSSGPAAGESISIDDDFFVARPGDTARKLNDALDRGQNLLFTPGVYHLDRTLEVKHPETVVLGLGFATLVPDNGSVAMSIGDVKGVVLAGLLFDAGPLNSATLLRIGTQHGAGGHAGNGGGNDGGNPTSLHDVFFRIGGATPGKATTTLIVNSDGVLLDDIWAWRADHGNGVGWTANTANNGLIVNGDDVTAYGLFVEHYQQYEVVWNGNRGTVIFFQNEMPYDPPSQAAWTEAPGVDGWAALKVANSVTRFSAYGMGSYSFFNQGVDIFASNAFEVPATLPLASLHDLLTIFLDATHGRGGIRNVIDNTGGSSTVANPDTPVTVLNYP